MALSGIRFVQSAFAFSPLACQKLLDRELEIIPLQSLSRVAKLMIRAKLPFDNCIEPLTSHPVRTANACPCPDSEWTQGFDL